jgi:hypothetical protein
VAKSSLTRATVDAAFQLLLTHFKDPQKASGRLDEAIRHGDIVLWGSKPSGEWFLTDRALYASHMTIEAYQEPNGWHAKVGVTKAIDGFRDIKWAVARDAIKAVLAALAPVTTSPPRQGLKETTPVAAPKGPKGYAEEDWELLRVKCFDILRTNDDVQLNTPVSIRDTSKRIREWWKKRVGPERTPGRTQTEARVKVWVTLYKRALPLDD